jgi:hypothetical protein
VGIQPAEKLVAAIAWLTDILGNVRKLIARFAEQLCFFSLHNPIIYETALPQSRQEKQNGRPACGTAVETTA